MKHINNSVKIIILLFLSIVGIYSCSDADEYLKYTEGGEVLYTGTLDSLKILPGKNRVKVEALIIGDPKISDIKIYWSNNKKSISIPVTRTQGVDTVSYIIEDLEENIYNFEIRTFDKDGNSSIPKYTSSEVFGERYQESLFNRPIVSNVLIESNLIVNFADMDLSSGVFGLELDYTSDTDELKTAFVSIDSTSVSIPNYKNGSAYKYRSVFIPDELAIDTFHAEYTVVKPIPTPVLKNATVPFIASETDGRWGNLEDWITNDAAKNHNGFGGWDEWNQNIFNLESGWGSPAITNGKIYQVVSAQPATYMLKVKLMNTNHQESDEGGAYLVVSKGDGIPDVEQLDSDTNVLAYKRILEASGTDYTIEFTLEETTDISIGELTTQHGDTPGRFANILSFEIIVK